MIKMCHNLNNQSMIETVKMNQWYKVLKYDKHLYKNHAKKDPFSRYSSINFGQYTSKVSKSNGYTLVEVINFPCKSYVSIVIKSNKYDLHCFKDK